MGGGGGGGGALGGESSHLCTIFTNLFFSVADLILWVQQPLCMICFLYYQALRNQTLMLSYLPTHL